MQDVIVREARLRWPVPGRLKQTLVGARFKEVNRRAKYLLLETDRGILMIHLGMSGRMLISGDPLGRFVHDHPAPEKHDHVVFHMDNGARITFNDPRRFGAMDLMATPAADTHPLLAKLGPEPLGNGFHEAHLAAALAGRRMPVKAALLDQRIVAGLGNIYVCEALFRARISPRRLAGNLGPRRIARLVPAIREVLRDAMEAGGSSLRDYRQADGELGYFQHAFDVYGREGTPCRTPGCEGWIARIVQAARSSFYCPRCQR